MTAFLRLLAAASIVGALAAFLRELFRDRPELLARSEHAGSTRSGQRKRNQTKSSRRSAPRAARSDPKRDGRGPSREKLYEEAQRLEIKGRSKMKKDQLERAVKKARAAR
jgi:DNA end-binding protein Ku